MSLPLKYSKYLGVNVGNILKSEKNLVILNCNKILPKTEALLSIWSSRDLSMVVFKIFVLLLFPEKTYKKTYAAT